MHGTGERDISTGWRTSSLVLANRQAMCSCLVPICNSGDWYNELSLHYTEICKFTWCKTKPEEGKLPALKDFAESFQLAIHASNNDSYFCQVEPVLNHIVTARVQGDQRCTRSPDSSEVLHPTQKHLDMLDHAICATTKVGENILDPCWYAHHRPGRCE